MYLHGKDRYGKHLKINGPIPIMVADMVITIQLPTIAEEEIRTTSAHVILIVEEETITPDRNHTAELTVALRETLLELDHRVRQDSLPTQDLE